MRDVKKFIFWADNCAAQNKNWWLFTALVREVNITDGPELITIKYFEPVFRLFPSLNREGYESNEKGGRLR